MKKRYKNILIIGAIGVILIIILSIVTAGKRKNDEPIITTTLEMIREDGVHEVIEPLDTQYPPDYDIHQKIEDENAIADLLAELDFIDEAIVSILVRDTEQLSVGAILHINREPNQIEMDSVIEIITLQLSDLEIFDILIADQNGDIIYSK